MKKPTYEILNIKISDTNEAIKGKKIFYKCNICESIIPSSPKGNVYCSCGNIGIDKDLNRLFVESFSDFVVLKRIT